MKRDEMNAHVHPLFQQILAPFAPPDHFITRESTGGGLKDTVTPVCSCGWRGRPVPEWKNYQLEEVAAQEAEHRFSGCSVDQMRKVGAL